MSENHNRFKQRLGKNIRRHRILKDMQATEVSKNAGIDYQYYLDIEKGKGNPSIKMLCIIAATIGVPLWELVKEAEDDAGESDEDSNETDEPECP